VENKIKTKDLADDFDTILYEKFGMFTDSLAFSKYIFNNNKTEYHLDVVDIDAFEKANPVSDLIGYRVASSMELLRNLLETYIVKDGKNDLTGTVVLSDYIQKRCAANESLYYIDQYVLSPFIINGKEYNSRLYIQVVNAYKDRFRVGSRVEFIINRNGNNISFNYNED